MNTLSMQFGGMSLMNNMNDDVIRKTKVYLEQFSQFKDFEMSKKMRDIGKLRGIQTELVISIFDLGLRDYDEAIFLFPKLAEYPKEHVIELIEEIKLNSR